MVQSLIAALRMYPHKFKLMKQSTCCHLFNQSTECRQIDKVSGVEKNRRGDHLVSGRPPPSPSRMSLGYLVDGRMDRHVATSVYTVSPVE